MAHFKKIVVFCLVFFWTAAAVGAAEELPVIRMAVADKVNGCRVGISGPFVIRVVDPSLGGKDSGNRTIVEGKRLESSSVCYTQGNMKVGDNQFPSRRILLCAQDSDIRVDNRPFGRRLEIVSSDSGQLTVISLLDLEEYTVGVLCKEVEPTWPLDVLKAQAILARTNAVYAYLRNKDKLFYLSRCSPQMYERIADVPPNAVKAVEETQGLVLTYNGSVIPAYFHSACGGGTEAAKNVWQKSQAYPGAVACNHCQDAPRLCWTSKIRISSFEKKLVSAGFDVEGVTSVYNSKLSAVSERVTEIVVEHAKGKTFLRTNTLRELLGHNNIRSTNFTVRRQGGTLYFQGQGWGHGVGLCQWGARAMAAAGRDFEEILKYYYPGARIAGVKK